MIVGDAVAGARPTPWTLKVNNPFTTSLLLIVTVPVCGPADVGANLIWKVAIPPGASVSELGWLTTLKAAPVVVTGNVGLPISINVDLPLLVIV